MPSSPRSVARGRSVVLICQDWVSTFPNGETVVPGAPGRAGRDVLRICSLQFNLGRFTRESLGHSTEIRNFVAPMPERNALVSADILASSAPSIQDCNESI